MSNITGNIGQQGGQASTSLQPTSFDILTLLQQQQAMLQQVIDKQAAFRSKMSETETRKIAVGNLLKDSCSSSSSSGTPKQTKHQNLRDLSVSLEFFLFTLFTESFSFQNKISTVYNVLGEKDKFVLSERYYW